MNLQSYKLIRSKRKSLALSVDDEARLVVRAPLKLPQRDIEAFIERKALWITRRQKQVAEDAARFREFSLKEGESILLYGEVHVIKRSNISKISVEENLILMPQSTTLEGFTKWMRSKAKKLIRGRVAYYAELMGANYAAVRVTSAKRRWGSCGAKNTLNFSWRLVMCPRWVIDYVVVHELCHIAFKNHSPEFWQYVARHMPNYKEARSWLRKNQKLMDVI